MPSDIGVKMGVTGLAQFKQSMNQAQQSVKTLDAALKLNEKQYKANGDAETYMQQKSKLLQQQIAAQNTVVKQGQQALDAMAKNGVDPASKSYQQMSQRVLEAQSALLDMHGDLDSVGQSAQATTQKTDQLTNSLNGINKKVNFDAVLGGIGKITSGMEAAAKKVESLARDVWATMAMAGAWADNENTLAAMYGLDVETLQRMQGASRTIDTSVESIIKSQQKLKNNMTSGSKDFDEAIKKLDVSLTNGSQWWKNTEGQTGAEVRERIQEAMKMRDFTDIFWDIGDAILHYDDAIERDAMAQKIFGTSWRELIPLFQAGRKEYEETLDAQSIVTQENVDKLNALDDALQKLDQDYQATKYTLLSEFAPAFTAVGGTLSDLLGRFNEYLQTGEGQEKLDDLSQAVTDLFSGLSDADFGQAIDTAGGILDTITGALEWIRENHGEVETAIKGIGGAFLTLKAAEVVGGLAQGANALKQLFGGGAAAAGGAAAGASGGAVTTTAGTAVSGLAKGLGIGALFKTGAEMTKDDPLTLWGRLNGAKGPQAISISPSSIVPTATELRRSRYGSNLETASEESMRTAVENVYDRLYQAINDYDPNTSTQNTTQFFDNVLYPLIQEAGQERGVVGDSMAQIADLIYDKWIQSLFDDEWEGTTGGLLNILQEAIDANAQGLTVDTMPVLPEDAADALQSQLSSLNLSVPVTAVPRFGVMSHANGLPFVPFDGYIAALHKGERVVPANQNRNYTANSNLYVETMNMNNGTDAQGLAAAMAAENRRIRAGFGS